MPEPLTASVTLWHPRGVPVRLPLAVGGPSPTPAELRGLLTAVSDALDAGWLVAAPGLAAGENRETVGAVVRRSKDDKDGGTTPVIDLYGDGDPMSNRYKLLSVYLNTDEDVSAFERASGLRLDQIPLYVGAAPMERTKSRSLDALVVIPPRPFAVAWRCNPKHDPNETDTKLMKAKRLFSRWPDLPAAVDAIAAGRAGIAAATTLTALASLWQSMPAEVQRALEGDKESRKAELGA